LFKVKLFSTRDKKQGVLEKGVLGLSNKLELMVMINSTSSISAHKRKCGNRSNSLGSLSVDSPPRLFGVVYEANLYQEHQCHYL
jgi:hypothetical protein